MKIYKKQYFLMLQDCCFAQLNDFLVLQFEIPIQLQQSETNHVNGCSLLFIFFLFDVFNNSMIAVFFSKNVQNITTLMVRSETFSHPFIIVFLKIYGDIDNHQKYVSMAVFIRFWLKYAKYELWLVPKN